mgnify:CR=1 FL=1|jgi:hypothetical protein|tara:strand:+ start:36169 stop:36765 length:597 start_codon:yes stop_codon:yes gene_type:complete
MALPVSDLQFTIKVLRLKLPEMKKQLKAISDDLDKISDGSANTRHNAATRWSKKKHRSAMNHLSEKLNKRLKGIEGGTQDALAEVLEQVRMEAVSLTPKDTGDLQNSSYVATELTPKFVWGRVGYNITSGSVPAGVVTGVNYAALVHEINTNHPNGGQWKFLQTAVERNQKSLGSKLKAAIKKSVQDKKSSAATSSGG